jgi:hypothetical protein
MEWLDRGWEQTTQRTPALITSAGDRGERLIR